MLVERPSMRSHLRLLAGRCFFTWRRYLWWYLSGTSWAGPGRAGTPLPAAVCGHRTPLLRPLRNVDMWLQYNKINNLKLAVSRLNGSVLRPGETLSFWRAVGRPTRRRGYLEGMILHNGAVRPEVGGGLCQLSNLIYWMTLHTPLTVTERWRHNYDVFPDAGRTQPFGSGATVAYNYIDLQIRNDTGEPYQLLVWLDDTHLNGEWRCERALDHHYQVYETGHRIVHQAWGGYTRHNELRRRIFRGDAIIGDEFVCENHGVMMYQPLLPDNVDVKDPGDVR